jgi:hypothetical protein
MTAERLTRVATHWIQECLFPGAVALDATVGNGQDTLFLADRVGTSGQVIGFDVQKIAINAATETLRFAGLLSRVNLILDNHAHLDRYLGPASQLNAAMFSLGGLPRGNPTIVTQAESTVQAITIAEKNIKPAGRISVLTHLKPDTAKNEHIAVQQLFNQFSSRGLLVRELECTLIIPSEPRLFLLEKR